MPSVAVLLFRGAVVAALAGLGAPSHAQITIGTPQFSTYILGDGTLSPSTNTGGGGSLLMPEGRFSTHFTGDMTVRSTVVTAPGGGMADAGATMVLPFTTNALPVELRGAWGQFPTGALDLTRFKIAASGGNTNSTDPRVNVTLIADLLEMRGAAPADTDH